MENYPMLDLFWTMLLLFFWVLSEMKSRGDLTEAEFNQAKEKFLSRPTPGPDSRFCRRP
ncbi:SHOCT domain-containing protein [Streptomyces sp. H10-C2]|uniref:SHOCT domain-containing protein n=1 Tax=unclassified Streptomyces TaxID=2593676 RepID=UPI0024BACE48|nr:MULTISPECIES: SHOCT domain-containing protein [unclassified Streptomyces]MDJ0345352.1 SHOCT domain-containing protein [Streptomyces sp. PH10-H1]MDJ0374209.1 SHOCT domain-containing protein [Streptomyces sp. H10-C2]